MNKVRLAFVTSVMCSFPLVSFHMRKESMVPKIASPLDRYSGDFGPGADDARKGFGWGGVRRSDAGLEPMACSASTSGMHGAHERWNDLKRRATRDRPTRSPQQQHRNPCVRSINRGRNRSSQQSTFFAH